MARFYQGAEWRFVLTDRDSQPITSLERIAMARRIVYRLNQPAEAQMTVPSDDPRVNIPHDDGAPYVSYNDRLVYGLRREGGSPPWVCRFAGIAVQVEDAVSGDQPYTPIKAWDPWQYLFRRAVKDGTSLVGPAGLVFSATRGDVIVQQLLEDTIAADGDCYIELGSFEATAELDITFQQGTSVGAALQQLCQTWTLDIEFAPVYDPGGKPGVCSTVRVYAQKGTTRDDAVFSWDVGRSVVGISDLLDGSQMANDVQFYNGQGGPPVTPAVASASQARYGVWSEHRFFPAQVQEPAVVAMAQLALDLQKQGRRTVTLTPSSLLAPVPLRDYALGDRVPVYATKRLRQPIPWAGEPVYQRVYGIPITLSDDGVERVERLVASPDGVSS